MSTPPAGVVIALVPSASLRRVECGGIGRCTYNGDGSDGGGEGEHASLVLEKHDGGGLKGGGRERIGGSFKVTMEAVGVWRERWEWEGERWLSQGDDGGLTGIRQRWKWEGERWGCQGEDDVGLMSEG